jgi:hypothetical protein
MCRRVIRLFCSIGILTRGHAPRTASTSQRVFSVQLNLEAPSAVRRLGRASYGRHCSDRRATLNRGLPIRLLGTKCRRVSPIRLAYRRGSEIGQPLVSHVCSAAKLKTLRIKCSAICCAQRVWCVCLLAVCKIFAALAFGLGGGWAVTRPADYEHSRVRDAATLVLATPDRLTAEDKALANAALAYLQEQPKQQ